PCPDNDKHQFIEQRGASSKNVVDVSFPSENVGALLEKNDFFLKKGLQWRKSCGKLPPHTASAAVAQG
ncbi:MAG: hypothetical protein IJN23_07395, partial [Akkermansia sp.]|nr:hypothetical protein [Akkermansia sp.]